MTDIFGVRQGPGRTVQDVISLSFRQARCPAGMLGRVSASYYTLTYSCMAFGAVLAGMLGSLCGIRPALWIISGILASASIILFFSPIRHVHDLPERSQSYTTNL
jgi:hypothetical protein